MFKEWCKSNGFANANSLSHVLMDGGVLSVPFDRLDDFYTTCIKCIQNGENIYVVEQKTELYNFFLDIDYKDEEALTLEEIKNISKVICDKVKSLGGKDCIISIAEPKKVGHLIKTGIHFNWYGFVVDKESALTLRDHIVSTLKLVYANQDWNDIVDIAVYGERDKKNKGAGFRMVWSHKMGKHEPCGGRGCSDCNNYGKVTQSPYLPVFKYIHRPLNMITEVSQEPTVEMLKLTTVRTECLLPAQVRPLAKSKIATIKEGGFSKHQTKNELVNSELQAYLETFIRQNMEGQSDARITRLFKHKKTILISSSSHFCENLGREHNSNHIWFYVVDNIIMQKCFCTCETSRGRRSGFCKDFSGRRHIIPEKITEKLYTPEDNVKAPPPEVKPVVIVNDGINTLIAEFINRNILGQKDVQVTKVSKKRNVFTVETTANYCEKADKHHDHTIPFVIEKGIIIAKCPCNEKKFTPRGHILSSKILDRIIPPKKKTNNLKL